MPNSAPSISAATSNIMDIAKLIRNPDKMPGIAPGSTILRTIETQHDLGKQICSLELVTAVLFGWP